MLEFSNWEFTANIVHMLRALMNTVDDMQEQTGNISREMETLRTNQKEMLEIKKKKTAKHCNRHDTPFNRLISRLHRAKERISKLENISVEFLKTEK